MSRRLSGLTLDNQSQLPDPCRDCVFWEVDPVSRQRLSECGGASTAKSEWLSNTLLEWGSCGQVLHVDDEVAGFITYAPAAFVPGGDGFATSPVSPDAVLLMTARVLPRYAGGGLGRVLVQSAARDLVRRQVRAIEAFAVEESGRASRETACLLPADYLRAVGFRTVRKHSRTPRLRLDLRSALTWRADLEAAVDRLLASIRRPVPARSQADR